LNGFRVIRANIGAAEDKLDTGPVIFSPDELNTFYSLDPGADLPGPSIPSSTSNQADYFAFHTVLFSDVKRAIRLIKSNAVGIDGIPLKFVNLFPAFDFVTADAPS
jgi:hypothetical protein